MNKPICVAKSLGVKTDLFNFRFSQSSLVFVIPDSFLCIVFRTHRPRKGNSEVLKQICCVAISFGVAGNFNSLLLRHDQKIRLPFPLFIESPFTLWYITSLKNGTYSIPQLLKKKYLQLLQKLPPRDRFHSIL